MFQVYVTAVVEDVVLDPFAGSGATLKIAKELNRKYIGYEILKNYLIKFGWSCHPIKPTGKLDKQVLYLTDLGRQINQCENLECVKDLYTNYFLNYSFNGLNIVQFTKRLLHRLNHLTLDEFNCFATHAYNDEDYRDRLKPKPKIGRGQKHGKVENQGRISGMKFRTQSIITESLKSRK